MGGDAIRGTPQKNGKKNAGKPGSVVAGSEKAEIYFHSMFTPAPALRFIFPQMARAWWWCKWPADGE